MPEVDSKTKIETNLQEPPLFRVVYINDEKTSMDFVIGSLIEFFRYTPETAERITQDIHATGAATVAVLPYETAEQKGVEVTMAARMQSYPLQIKLEPDIS